MYVMAEPSVAIVVEAAARTVCSVSFANVKFSHVTLSVSVVASPSVVFPFDVSVVEVVRLVTEGVEDRLIVPVVVIGLTENDIPVPCVIDVTVPPDPVQVTSAWVPDCATVQPET